jgi:predicted DNA-binding transcriptional regulator AlpA
MSDFDARRGKARAQMADVGEVADMLRISERQVWRMEAEGKLPKAIRLTPRIVRWRVADIVRFLEKGA